MPHPASSSSSAKAPVSPAPPARAAQVDGDFARALDAANFAAADESATGDSSVSPPAPTEPRSRVADADSAERETGKTERRAARRGHATPDVVLALALAPLAPAATPLERGAASVAAPINDAPATPAAAPQASARAQQPIVAGPATNPAATASGAPNATVEGLVSLVGTAEAESEGEPVVANPSKAAPEAGSAAAKPAVGPSGATAHQAAAVAVAVAAPATQGVSADPQAPTASDAAVATPDPTTPSPGDGASADAGGEGQQGAGGQPHGAKATEAEVPAPLQNNGAAASSSSSPVPPVDAAAARPAPGVAATPAQITPQATAALASAVVSNAVAAASAGLRRTRFEVQLDGSDLGRIDVRLDIGRGGRVGAKLTVDSAEARDLLQTAARALQRTLEQAGFRLPEGGFTVEVRSGGADGGDPQARREPAGGLSDAHEADTPIGRDAAPIAYRPLRAAASALDVRV